MTDDKLPLYAKIATILFGLSLTVVVFFFGRDVLIPLVFAALLSVLPDPLTGFLEKRKFPRMLSVSIVVAIASIVFLSLVTFIGMRVGQFEDDLPRQKGNPGIR